MVLFQLGRLIRVAVLTLVSATIAQKPRSTMNAAVRMSSVCHGGNRGRIIMFKLAVWTAAIALQMVGSGITSPRAADEPSGSNLTPVTVADFVQSTAAAPKPSTRSIRQTSLSSPIEPSTAVNPHPLKSNPVLLACYARGHGCNNDSDCCTHICITDAACFTTTGRCCSSRR
jgi:hypothetical protein